MRNCVGSLSRLFSSWLEFEFDCDVIVFKFSFTDKCMRYHGQRRPPRGKTNSGWAVEISHVTRPASSEEERKRQHEEEKGAAASVCVCVCVSAREGAN